MSLKELILLKTKKMKASKNALLFLFITLFPLSHSQDEAEEDKNLFEEEEDKQNDDEEEEGEDLLENQEKFLLTLYFSSNPSFLEITKTSQNSTNTSSRV